MPVVCSAKEMGQLDELATKECQIPSIVLMENAGRAVAARCEELLETQKKQNKGHFGVVIILCGGGNNGGDGFVVARVLADHGYQVHLLMFAKEFDLKNEARTSFAMLRFSCPNISKELVPDNPSDEWLLPRIYGAALIVDAILGNGLSRPLSGNVAAVIQYCNDMAHCPVVAVDVPTGVKSDSGQIDGVALQADETITFSCLKPGHLLEPAASLVGKLTLREIGVPNNLIQRSNLRGRALFAQEAAALLPRRPRTAHKGTFGHAVLVGGSIGKIGAMSLCALGALRSGVGLCTVCSPRQALALEQQLPPEVMTAPYDVASELSDIVSSLLLKKGAVAFGPGWASTEAESAFLYSFLQELDRPIVLDAAALRIAAQYPKLLPNNKRNFVITPHPGEMSELMRRPVEDILNNPLGAACAVAAKYKITVVLKGAPTVIASPDGYWSINTTGNNGLATGGSGDLLTGVLTSLLAQGMEAYDAACLGCYLHGLAADLAAADFGGVSLLPTDVAGYLGRAILSLQDLA